MGNDAEGDRDGVGPDVDTAGFETVVVDIDGTLLDSNYQHTLAWARAFAHVGRRVPLWKIHRHIGMGGDKLVEAVAGQDAEQQSGDTLRDRWEQEFDVVIDETRLFDGARELLDGCQAAGLDVVLASSSIPRHADHALRQLDAPRRTDAWTTSGDAEESKPSPELIDEALSRVDGGPAVMIGDSVWDVVAARRAGLPTLGLLTGGFGAAELLEAGAAAVYDGPRDLLDHLTEALATARAAMAATQQQEATS